MNEEQVRADIEEGLRQSAAGEVVEMGNFIQHSHSITAEEYARTIAKVYEPGLDWDNPTEYDLLDRTELIETASRLLKRLAWDGFVIERLDDLALDEFN